MVKKNNPVGRLLTIISKAHDLSNELPSHSNLKKKSAWISILEMEGCSELELIRAMLDLSDLARKSRQLIDSFAPNSELFLEKYEVVELSVLPNEMDTPFVETFKFVTEDIITRLKFSCDMISKVYDEGEVKSQDISNITSSVNDLYDEVKESNLDAQVKNFLLESIEGIRRAITHYDIYGAKGLRDAFQSALGGIVANKDALKEAGTNNKNILDKFGIILSKVDCCYSNSI